MAIRTAHSGIHYIEADAAVELVWKGVLGGILRTRAVRFLILDDQRGGEVEVFFRSLESTLGLLAVASCGFYQGFDVPFLPLMLSRVPSTAPRPTFYNPLRSPFAFVLMRQRFDLPVVNVVWNKWLIRPLPLRHL